MNCLGRVSFSFLYFVQIENFGKFSSQKIVFHEETWKEKLSFDFLGKLSGQKIVFRRIVSLTITKRPQVTQK